MGIAIAIHTVFAVIWVGGMFFAYLCLRPALAGVDGAVKAGLWAGVLSRFFAWVIASIVALLLTGFYMLHQLRVSGAPIPVSVHWMIGLGILMMLLFAHVFFAPFKRLKKAVATGDAALAVKQIGMIRLLVAINLGIGLLVVIIGAGGPYLGQLL